MTCSFNPTSDLTPLKSLDQKHCLLVLKGKPGEIHLAVKKLNWFHRLVRWILPKSICHKLFKSDPRKIGKYLSEHPEMFKNAGLEERNKLIGRIKQYFNTSSFNDFNERVNAVSLDNQCNASKPVKLKEELSSEPSLTSPIADMSALSEELEPPKPSQNEIENHLLVNIPQQIGTPAEISIDHEPKVQVQKNWTPEFEKEVLEPLKNETSGDGFDRVRMICQNSPHYNVEIRPYDNLIDRYCDILPNAGTLVHSGVNSNWIRLPGTRPLIAVSAPKQIAFSAFYEMVEQEGVTDIVVLETKQGKIDRYWPLQGDCASDFDGFKWKRSTLDPKGVFQCIELEKEGGHVLRIHEFLKWPDHGVVHPSELYSFLAAFKENSNADHPAVVHCSAGVGRAGTFIAAHYALENSNKNELLNPAQCMALMRTMRGKMIQTPEQLKLVHETHEWSKQRSENISVN